MLGILTGLEDKKSALVTTSNVKHELIRNLLHHSHFIPSQRLEITRNVDESKLQYSKSADLMNSVRSRVQDIRKEGNELSGKFEVDKELLVMNKTVIDRRSTEASQSIAETLSELNANGEKISVLKRRISNVEQNLTVLRLELREILDKKSSFMDRRTVVYQKLEQFNSVLIANQALLKATGDTLALTIANNQKHNLELRNLREREYANLDILKGAQLDLVKIETTRVQISKKQAAARSWMDSACNRKASLEEVYNRAQEELDVVKHACAVAEASAGRLSHHSEELELSHMKVDRQTKDSLSRLADTEALNQKLVAELNALRQESTDCFQEIERRSEMLDESADTNAKSASRLEELTGRNRSLREDSTDLDNRLNHIKRINVDKKFPPILIESDSALMDRLQINAFLRLCQTQSQPLPALVEKIADILGILEEARSRADKSLATLCTYNARISAYRESNAELQVMRIRLESFKTSALVNYLENLTTNAQVPQEAIFELLELGSDDLKLIKHTIKRLALGDKLQRISFSMCNLYSTCMPPLKEIVLNCPYLSKLELSRNEFGPIQMADMRDFLVSIDGITDVTEEVPDSEFDMALPKGRNEGTVLVARSGQMIRLRVEFMFQFDKLAVERCSRKPKTQACVIPETTPIDVKAPRDVVKVPEQILPPATFSLPSGTPAAKQSLKKTFPSSESVSSDQSFRRQLQISRRDITEKACRLGIKHATKKP